MKLYIYGCSPFGLELELWLRESNLYLGGYGKNHKLEVINFCGFLGDKAYIQKDYLSLFKGGIEILDKHDSLLMAVGENLDFRQALSERLRGRVLFPNMIHKSAIFCASSLGCGNVISPYCIFSVQCRIGSFNVFGSKSEVAHNAVVGSYNSLFSFGGFMGFSKVGDKNLFGVASYLLPRAQVGSNNTIAPGSFIYKRFRDNCLIQGNPATAIKRA